MHLIINRAVLSPSKWVERIGEIHSLHFIGSYLYFMTSSINCCIGCKYVVRLHTSKIFYIRVFVLHTYFYCGNNKTSNIYKICDQKSSSLMLRANSNIRYLGNKYLRGSYSIWDYVLLLEFCMLGIYLLYIINSNTNYLQTKNIYEISHNSD